MTREELIRKVALKMDEISSSDDVKVSVDISDNNPLYTQINGLLNESVNDVLMKAPIYRLHSQVVSADLSDSSGNLDVGDLVYCNRRVAKIKVPADFLRLVSITDINVFRRPITELAIEGDDIDKRQHNPHLIAKYAKPVAVIGDTNGERVITCYSYEQYEVPMPTFLYVKRYDKATLSEDTGLDEYLTDIISWVCAGRVFAAQGDINKGKVCDENASALMI